MNDVIEILEQVKTIKKRVKRCIFYRHILPMLLIIYIIILPIFYIWILVKGWLGFLLLWFLIISIVIAFAIRKIWLHCFFGEQLRIYNQSSISIKPDIKFIEFCLFVDELRKNPIILNRRKEIILKITEELLSYVVSLYEHKVTIFIFAIILSIIGSSITYIIQSAFPVKTIGDVKNYLLMTIIVLFFIFIPWLISKGFLDRFANKHDLREIKEFLDWLPILTKHEK